METIQKDDDSGTGGCSPAGKSAESQEEARLQTDPGAGRSAGALLDSYKSLNRQAHPDGSKPFQSNR